MELQKYLTGIQHIGIPTNDIIATTNFYKRIGFTITLDTINKAENEKVVFLQNNNLIIEVYQNYKATMCKGAIDHIALDVTDINKVYSAVLAADLQVLESEIQYLPFWENGVRFFNIEGPNKEIIEFSQRL